ncbi:MAG: hypothetical protein ACI8ZB_003794 [Desulforhopalus sp.]|jgi:hypothetical protein
MIALNRLALVLLMLFFFAETACAKRFAPKEALAYRISDIGGCKIISLPKDAPIPYKIRRECNKAPLPEPDIDNTWHDFYSSIELSLGSSLEISLRSFSKSHEIWQNEITKHKDIHVVLIHDPLANAGIAEFDDFIIIMFNDGLIELIENAASALEMMTSTLPAIKGVNYRDWLELMRTPRSKKDNRIIGAGPDRKGLHAPTWFWATRIKASILYQFIIGHELAHIYRGDLLKPSDISLEKEMSCDELSFDAFFANGDEKLAMNTVLPFLVSMWYYEQYWSNEIRDSGITLISDLYPDLFTRNWNERAKRLLKRWTDINGDNNDSQKAKSMYSQLLFGLRPPFDSTALVRDVQEKIITSFNNVEYHRPPKVAEVEYSLGIINTDKYNPVKIVIEVQSRIFDRHKSSKVSSRSPRDYKERYYQVIANNVHTITIPPEGFKNVKGTLPWVGDRSVYPGIAKRIVAADYAD